MKTTRILCAAGILLFSLTTLAQRAKDGDLVISTPNQVLNTYTYLTSDATTGNISIFVNSNSLTGGAFGSPLAAGDVILIIQMQGATIDCNTYPAENGWGNYTVPDQSLWEFDVNNSNHWWNSSHVWGSLKNYNNAGKFERAEVMGVSGGNVINLQCGLKNNYTASGHVQIVRIPRFNNLTVNSGGSIIPSTWNGQTGGIVALEVETALEINSGGLISASGKGFRAGMVDASGKAGTAAAHEPRFLGTSDAAEGSEKGESIVGYTTEYNALYSRYGISAPANGGGGGGYQNCGGGGGSNIGAGTYTGYGVPVGYAAIWNLENPPIGGTSTPGGGRGGYALSQNNMNEATTGPENTSWGGDMRKMNGGRGGHPLTYDATRIFFGGGGGAGDQDSGQGGSGGAGGGIVFITSYGTVTGAGAIEVKGNAGQNTNPTNAGLSNTFTGRSGNDGAGGGGAGGSIYFENATAMPATLTLSVQGGDGGDQNLAFGSFLNPNNNNDGEAGGPGGSGAGGSIAFSSGVPTQVLTAGTGGTTNSPHVTNFPPNGATSGASGTGSLSAPYFDLIPTNATICAGNTANVSVTINGTLPAGGTVYWYTQRFGGAPINSGLTYTTPVLATTTTYYVGVCSGGTFRVPVTVTVISSPNLVITDPAPVCNPATVDLTTPAVTSGSDSGTLSYWTDAGATSTLAAPSVISSSGVYYIKLDIGGGCTATEAVNVSVDSPEDASFSLSSTCDGATVSSVTTPGGTYTFNVTPSDAAVINGTNGTISGGSSNTSYDVLYTTNGTCPNSSVQSVTSLVQDDATFTMSATCDGATVSSVTTLGGTFSFNTAPSDAASINGSTGAISGGSSNTGYDILYLTNGSCPTSSNQIVTSLSQDDPSFTMAGTCDGGTVNSVTTPGGSFSFNIAPADAAVINTTSGTISNGTSGGSYDVLYQTNGTCPASQVVSVTATFSDDASFNMSGTCDGAMVSSVATAGGTFDFNTIPADAATIIATTGTVSGGTPGATYDVQYTTGGTCSSSSTQMVTALTTDDAAFSLIATCDGATVNSVATPGGNFSFNTTPSDAAIIDGLTGTISGGTSNTMYDVLYLTNGSCPASSTQMITSLIQDDASFALTATCDGATVTSVATPGGTYDFDIVPSDAALINSSSGTVSGGTPSNSYNIIYTTNGACPASSVEIVTALPLDDASFIMSPTCDGGVVSSVTTSGGSFSFDVPPSDAAVINGTTGSISNGTSGTTYSVSYLTNQTCSASQVVSVTASFTDDATFSMEGTCNGAIVINVVTSGGSFTFNTIPSDGAILDLNSGEITNGTSGATYDVMYTTGGTCSASSTFLVTLLVQDDATFAMTSNCDGGTVASVATPGGSFSFETTPTDGATINNTSGTVTSGASGESYTIVYTTNGVCPASATEILTVLINDDPAFALTATCDGAEVNNVATTDGTFSFGQTPSDAAVIDQTTGAITGGSYATTYSILYTTNGTCPKSMELNITSLDCDTIVPIEIVVPTAFTPAEGPNNEWEIPGLDENYPDNAIQIFNRWGNLVFEHSSSLSNPYNLNRWDGNYNGDALPVGSYYFIIEPNDDKAEAITGIVTIIRN